MHPVRVGTCGWSYKEWSGVFYPKGLPAGEFLAYVAQQAKVGERPRHHVQPLDDAERRRHPRLIRQHPHGAVPAQAVAQLLGHPRLVAHLDGDLHVRRPRSQEGLQPVDERGQRGERPLLKEPN